MSTVWRVRIDNAVLSKANRVTKGLGTSTQEMVRMFIPHIANSGKVPLKLDSDEDLLNVQHRNKILRELDDSEGW